MQSADFKLEHVPVYILAGGQSRRFGSDKARATLDGKPLILHVADGLRLFASSITAVAQVPEKYSDLGLRTIADLQPALGPVGGLLTALADCAAPWLLLTSCDLVGVARSSIQALLTADRRTAQVIAFKSGLWQPMPALYHRSLSPLVSQVISSDRRSMQLLLDSAVVLPLPHAAASADARGVNTPGELDGIHRSRHGA